MKMKIREVINKLKDIDAIIDRTDDDETVDILLEYKGTILETEVEIGG